MQLQQDSGTQTVYAACGWMVSTLFSGKGMCRPDRLALRHAQSWRMTLADSSHDRAQAPCRLAHVFRRYASGPARRSGAIRQPCRCRCAIRHRDCARGHVKQARARWPDSIHGAASAQGSTGHQALGKGVAPSDRGAQGARGARTRQGCHRWLGRAGLSAGRRPIRSGRHQVGGGGRSDGTGEAAAQGGPARR